MSGEIKFGILEGDPVVWNDTHAFVYPTDKWKPIHRSEAMNAGVIPKARYDELFGNVPLPPAFPKEEPTA